MSGCAGPRSGLILSVNAGSSSLKISMYCLSNSREPGEPVTLLIDASVSSIGKNPTFSFSAVDKSIKSEACKDKQADQVKDHALGLAYFLNHLEEATGIDREKVVHVCHRIVHGGDYHTPIVITDQAYHHIERLSDLAPLHNGAALSVIKSCIDTLPHSNSIAYFDTAFHHNIPPHVSSYAIDPTVARKKGLRKYGFHGLSYTFVLRAVSKHLKKDKEDTSLIVLHLGSGASACAIYHGVSRDTSMGLTPASGLPGATRAGAIDATLIFHYTHEAGHITHSKAGMRDVGITEAEEILNKKAGWNALAGTTNFGEIVARRGDDKDAKLAFDIFVDRILDFVGAYFLKLDGRVDALVFTGGIGERSVELRDAVSQRCACLGFGLDAEKNKAIDDIDGSVVDIGEKLLVCRTDEQIQMARECALDARFWDSSA